MPGTIVYQKLDVYSQQELIDMVEQEPIDAHL